MPENSNEFMSLKEAITDVAKKLDTLHDGMNNLRVELSDKYVKKEEFTSMLAKNDDMHKSILTWLIGCFTLFVAAIGTIYAYCSNNFATIFQRLLNK